MKEPYFVLIVLIQSLDGALFQEAEALSILADRILALLFDLLQNFLKVIFQRALAHNFSAHICGV